MLSSCWNCGQYIGRGRVDDLRTPESAQQVQSNLKLDRRELTPIKAYMDKSETDIGLVTIYGVTKNDLQALMAKNHIEADQVDMPGLCTKDEMVTQGEVRRAESEGRAGTTGSSGGYSGSGAGAYYYNDPMDDVCCYYCCAPRYGYRSNTDCCSSSSSSRSRSRGSSNNCDCGDSGSDNDAFAIIAVILIVVAIIGILIFLGPSLIAAGFVLLDIAIGAILLLFNVLTLGIYRDDLSRHRLRIRRADPDNLNSFLIDLVNKSGVPRMPGYWSQGFIMMRYGALFTIVGVIVLVGMFLLDVSSTKSYLIPTAVILGALILFFSGNYSKNKKIADIKRNLGDI